MNSINLYKNYTILNINELLINTYFSKNLRSLYVKNKLKIIEDILYVDVYTCKMLLKVPDAEKHKHVISKITNFDKIVLTPTFFPDFKTDIKYNLDMFVRRLNQKKQLKIQTEISKYCKKLEKNKIAGFVFRLSGKITGLKHKIIKLKYGNMKYTGFQAQSKILNLKYKIYRSVGVFGLVVKILKDPENIPGKLKIYEKD